MIGPDTFPDDDVVITFTTPSGNPASANRSANANVVNGVNAAGLITTVHPAANAGPILRVPIANGKFHGVIAYTGPTGCFIVNNRVPPLGATAYRPETRTASSENHRKNSAPYVNSARASASGLPISNVINNAKSSARATNNGR